LLKPTAPSNVGAQIEERLMCGIAGELNFSRRPDADSVSRMVNNIRHRGPDASGVWISPSGECALGHARLSIIDLSPLGQQPMIDPLTGNALVFNGEIYNYRELRKACENAGDRFRSESDTEVILALYRRYGVHCVLQLRGMFAIALWDANEQRLFLARDRVGKKPLNYAFTPSGVVFCSEILPLSRHPAVTRELDVEALELYLQLQAVPSPWSIYRQIRKLPPAHFAIFDRNGLHIERYWNVDYRNKLKLSEDEALEALEEKLTESVRLRMISDVPVGALLSGGVDSSLVVALMSKLSGEPIRTFSIGFGEEAFNELPWAEQAARICGTLHHPQCVAGDVEHILPLIAKHYGEPFADSSAVPSFHVSRVAREHVTVVLNGDGGDELLGGYSRYAVPSHTIRFGTAIGRLLGPKGLVGLMPFWADAKSLPARATRRLAREVMSPEMGGLLMFMGYWNDALRSDLMGDHATNGLLQNWRLRWLSEAFEYADNPIDRMLWLDNRTYLSDDLMVKMDIASMHCGLEARSPLLDQEVIEFCARLPVNFKVNQRSGKYLLKRLAEKYFPHDFVHRKKMGFGIPVAQWLRGPLKQITEAVILDAALMEPLNMTAIRRAWSRLNSSKGVAADAEAGRIWTLLMYGQWRLIEREIP
jgi:asparagine synthase (glutamine-hydrolysing)